MGVEEMVHYKAYKIENQEKIILGYMNITFKGAQRNFCYERKDDLGHRIYTTLKGHELPQHTLNNLLKEQED